MERYPDICDHGLIGDLQTAALVSTEGTVDWFCCPRFDAPSVFASLLDADHGGYFSVAPESGDYVTRQLYFPDTAILITRFMTPDGVGEVTDFMPIAGDRPTDHHQIMRVLKAVRGTVRFAMEIRPRFNYGREPHKVEICEDGAVFYADHMNLTVNPICRPPRPSDDQGLGMRQQGDDLLITQCLHEGQTAGVALECTGGRPRRITPAETDQLTDETIRYWRDWVHRSTYRGRWRELVARSAITLKLMTYAPSGALVAAPTTALPELPGGERNWDYRYTWIRDASFSVYALLGLGYAEEAAAFSRWLKDRCHGASSTDSPPLNIMYRVDGSSDLTEETLDHFEGWRGSRPVRIGNGASDQLQLDIYGEALDAILHANMRGLGMGHDGWMSLTSLMDWLCDHWDQPEEGIWETRGGRKDFTYGRFQCWVALDRAIRLAAHRGRPANTSRWTAERDNIYHQIMSHGWNCENETFTQHYRTNVLDASLLLMPIMDFVNPMDPRWQSTLNAMGGELVSDSLVYRYNPSASLDGLRGREGTFSLCTFWYVDALARSGRLTEAELIFEKMQTYANHLGLYSEEIGLTGDQLGNFPQAFSHLSLITAAINLDCQLDHGPGNVEPVLARSAGALL